MSFLEHWKYLWFCLVGVYAIIAERRIKRANTAKEEAIAAQEKIKVQKEDVLLSQLIQETYQRLNKDVFQRLEELEKNYNEILLKNAILVERAENYEKKYNTLEKQHIKLKADHDKLHQENKEIRKELDELKEDKK